MAVIVYDRHGEAWGYSNGVAVDHSDSHLRILDDTGAVVGGFNQAAWSHVAIGYQEQLASDCLRAIS